MRGTKAKQRDQAQALQAMDARLGKARTVVHSSCAHMHALRQRLQPGLQGRDVQALADGLETDVQQIEAGLAQVCDHHACVGLCKPEPLAGDAGAWHMSPPAESS